MCEPRILELGEAHVEIIRGKWEAMKRAAKTVALGLSVAIATWGTAAFAQDTPPSTAPAPTPPATEPAPAAATPPTTEPAPAEAPAAAGGITFGTGAPKKDAPAPEKKKEEKKAEKPRPFAGTQVFAQTSMSTSTVFKDQQQYSNPTVDASLFILPRYTISKEWQLRARTTFTYEFTNSDSTQTRNEPRFGDTGLQLFYRGIPAVAGIKPQVAIGLSFPTSPESRARTMITTPSISAQLAKSIEHVGSGEIDLLLLGNYSHPLYTNTTGGIRGDFPYKRACWGGGSGCDDQLGGAANASDILSWSAIVAGTWGKFSPAFLFNMSHQFMYTFSKDQSSVPGQTVQRLDNAQTIRNATYFSFWLDYEANSWLTPEVGYFMSRSLLRDDGTYGNPFFDRNQDMRVYLGANINIDNLAKSLSGVEAEAGVVRAKNKTGPALGAY